MHKKLTAAVFAVLLGIGATNSAAWAQEDEEDTGRGTTNAQTTNEDESGDEGKIGLLGLLGLAGLAGLARRDRHDNRDHNRAGRA